VTKDLDHPWGIAFLPNGDLLVTERNSLKAGDPGQLRVIRNGVLDPTPIGPLPAMLAEGLGGMMDVSLHPQFAQNRLVYLSYTKPLDDKRRTVAVARGRFDGKALTEVKDVVVLDRAGTSRIAFGRDGMLYISTTGTDPQDPKDPQNPGPNEFNTVHSVAISADRKVTLTTRTVADLVSQVASINNAEMLNSLNAASAVMAPYPVAKLKVVVTSVAILLVALSTAAMVVPAWRAGRIDPAVTLRTD